MTYPFSPPPAADRPLNAKLSGVAQKHVRRGHPWVFDQAIQSLKGGRTDGEPLPGDVVIMYDNKRKFLAAGLYDPASPMRVRVVQRKKPRMLDAAFFAERLDAALARRMPLDPRLETALADTPHMQNADGAGDGPGVDPASGRPRPTAPALTGQTTGYRVVHGENDSFSGLVVDRYADTLVVKLYSTVWVPYLAGILDHLVKRLQPAQIVGRLARNLDPRDLHGLRDGQLLYGTEQTAVEFLENDVVFVAAPYTGQKTGFFLDQRDNRARVGALSQGARVLNVFSYNGGFSLFAAKGGAERVVSLDLSRPALDDAERLFARNADEPAIAACTHETLCGDAFTELEKLGREGATFDVVIIDPPSFAKRQSEIGRALSSYGRLCELGLDVLAPDGTIVLASCSSRVDMASFERVMQDAAEYKGRPLIIFDKQEHAVDHPIGFAEGAYLKAIYATA